MISLEEWATYLKKKYAEGVDTEVLQYPEDEEEEVVEDE